MKIEAGKYYKTRDGRKVGPMRDAGYCFYEDGKGRCEDPEWSENGWNKMPMTYQDDLIAEWTDEPDSDGLEYQRQNAPRPNAEPKLWRDMTPSQKGALLLAAHEGKTIEQHIGHWTDRTSDGFGDCWAYRVKPADPVVETVTLYGEVWAFEGYRGNEDTHRITFNLIDGKPDCDSIRMEEF